MGSLAFRISSSYIRCMLFQENDNGWVGLCQRAALGKLQSCRRFAEGAASTVYRLHTDGGDYAVKVAKPGRPSRLKVEHALLEKMGGKFAPAPRYFDGMHQHHPEDILVEVFVEGAHPFQLDQTQAGALGRTLRAIHATETSAFGNFLEASDWEAYLGVRVKSQWERARADSPPKTHAEVGTMIAAAFALARKLALRLSERKHCLVHTDVIPLNVIATPEQSMVLIDWEWARKDMPEWDIDSALNSFKMDQAALAAFHEAYALGYDAEILEFVGILSRLNIVCWRLKAYYAEGEYRDKSASFLADLNEELNWLRTRC